MARVRLERVSRHFGQMRAVDAVDLDLAEGSFCAILGPSGCGKTTLLRLLAGLERPTAGRILLDDDDITSLAPERRRLGMMFQSYALLPHLTVAENLRFPLRMQRLGDRGEQARRVAEALALVQLEGLGERLPRQLSGGQQQRVALARALIAEPRVLLLDEPLSNLDALLRKDMQIELQELHRQVGRTTVMVTHDQDEALGLADIVVLMQAGRIVQIADPASLYRRPRTAFAATFLGAANLLPVAILERGAQAWTVRLATGETLAVPPAEGMPGGEALLVLRQEELAIEPRRGGTTLAARLVTRVFQGAQQRLVVEAAGQRLRLVVPATSEVAGDGALEIHLPPGTGCLVPAG